MKEFRGKFLAGFLCACLLLTFFSFFSHMDLHQGHECPGEECALCACLESSKSLMKQMGLGLAFLATALLPVVFAACADGLESFVPLVPKTPVVLGVRMNN